MKIKLAAEKDKNRIKKIYVKNLMVRAVILDEHVHFVNTTIDNLLGKALVRLIRST